MPRSIHRPNRPGRAFAGRTFARKVVTVAASVGLLTVASACVSNTPEQTSSDDNQRQQQASTDNNEPGKNVTIGFSGPEADHGWLAAVNSSAIAEAKEFEDIELEVAEATNDPSLQIAQIETFINQEVDAIVLLPTDGAALTDVARKATEAGIPVVNVDREFSDPSVARTTILGNNYGMGRSAGRHACKLIEQNDISDPVIAEIAGTDSLPLTQDRTDGFNDALAECDQKVDHRVAANFTVESGEATASNLLQAASKLDIVWNHDDDQGVGVKQAFDNAGRDEFFFIGGGGSANAMRWIKAGEMEATVLYPPTQAADGIRLARLLAQGKGMSDLVQTTVPKRIVLDAPVVTKKNVDQYMHLGYES